MSDVRHFINLPDLNESVLKQILKNAQEMKASKMYPEQIFEGLSLAMIFDKPSTRTRLSFEVGFKQLGGHTLVMNKGDMQLGHSESIADTAKVFSRMVDAIMIRISNHADVEELAKHATIPIINALTNESHPCQIMADLMTVQEKKGQIKGLNFAWLGDYNNVAKTFVQAAPIFGFNLTMAMPEELHSKNIADAKVTTDAAAAIADADIVITDTWVSMGEEETKKAAALEKFKPYQVNAALMAKAKPDAIFMHCLPAHRGEEVTNDVMDGPQSVVFDEAENRLHVQKAILAWCLENAGVVVQLKKEKKS